MLNNVKDFHEALDYVEVFFCTKKYKTSLRLYISSSGGEEYNCEKLNHKQKTG